MNASIEFLLNKASTEQITEHLLRCDTDFVPPLSGRVEINDYAQKIASKATRFEAWSGGTLVGLVAAYCNNQEKRIAYITSVSVLKAWTGKGIAARLMSRCVEHAKALGMRQVSLEVASDNTSAIRLYEKSGYVAGKANAPFVTFDLYLKSGEEHGQQA
jgi:ribosomal protein S18 acetylase RimI-like enzyme